MKSRVYLFNLPALHGAAGVDDKHDVFLGRRQTDRREVVDEVAIQDLACIRTD